MGVASEMSTTAASAPRFARLGPETESDAELVVRCQEGDRSAFADLYRRHEGSLRRFCLRRLRNVEDAEEATQEAFTKAWFALPRFGGERRFYPWLTVIAGNVCTDMLRRRSRLVPFDETVLRQPDHVQDGADEEVLVRADRKVAVEALAHLSVRHQRILHMREESGWSSERIAAYEGVGIPAVDSLAWRARQALRREFVAIWQSGGRMAGVVVAGATALRQACRRLAMRMDAQLGPPARAALQGRGRGPIVLAAAVALAGATVGGVALGGAHHSSPAKVTTNSQSPSSTSQGLGQATKCVCTRRVSDTEPPRTSGEVSGRSWAGYTPSSALAQNQSGPASPPPSSAENVGDSDGETKTVSSPAEGASSATDSRETTGVLNTVTNTVTRVVGAATGTVTGVVQHVAGATSAVSQAVVGVVSGTPGTASSAATGALSSSLNTALGTTFGGTSSLASSPQTDATDGSPGAGGLLGGLDSAISGTADTRR
jgi:RNA polymerase sigma-70 factor, ECF subfamily